ncbi:MAG: hypothetical protein HY808_10745 [Nitrospirae bacterium]|nr:hypothetical protein [Nitrospirota bacterium]
MLKYRSIFIILFSVLVLALSFVPVHAACTDLDGDGYGSPGDISCPKGKTTDCNDNDNKVYPGAPKICDGKDNNCDGRKDFSTDEDKDHDGVMWCAGDCDDNNPNRFPGNPEICDGIDNDCVGGVPAAEKDLDQDGYRICSSPADCNDNDFSVNPGVQEYCSDTKDNNCNGQIDEAACICPDADGDGQTLQACGGTDCNDNDNTVYLGAAELCADGKDNDCDGITDIQDPNATGCPAYCVDADGDNYFVGGIGCGAVDCDDNDANVHPGAQRICDGKDSDCDGRKDFSTDEDKDHDGVAWCAGDCDDNNANRFPGNKEGSYGDPTCSDGIDNDCDSRVDATDADCAQPSCTTKTNPNDGVHVFNLLNGDGSTNKTSCNWCHFDDSGVIDQRRSCQRCHSDPADTSDPLNGVLKAQYPANPPYGFGTAKNVKMHSSSVAGTKYGGWTMDCLTCHNPHQQEQDLAYGATYGKYIKEYLCYDNPVTGTSTRDYILFTAASGAGSFADGVPNNQNICETCHTQTNHHRNDGSAPGDLDAGSNYVGHYDGQKCTDCHVHSEGFKFAPPAIDNGYVGSSVCGSCHTTQKADFDRSGHPYKYRTTGGAIPSPEADPLSAILSTYMPLLAALNTDANVTPADDGTGHLDWSSANYVIGGFGWKARWGIKDNTLDTGTLQKTGYVWSSTSAAQFNMMAADSTLDPYGRRADWSSYGSTTGQSKKYNCAVCHNTNGKNIDPAQSCYEAPGGRTEPWASNPFLDQTNHGGYYSEWTFDGVQCEACHGPGESHVNAPSVLNITKNTSLETCGKCHTRILTDQECYGTGTGGALVGGGYIKHHEQYNEMVGTVSAPGVHSSLTCVTCHDPHKRSHKVTDAVAAALGITDNHLSAEERGAVTSCAACHPAQRNADDAATSGKIFAHKTAGVTCADCHMAEATKSATHASTGSWGKMGDAKTHIFKINPSATAPDTASGTGSPAVAYNYLSLEYACGKCHAEAGGKDGLAGTTTVFATKADASAEATGYHNVTGIDGGFVGSESCSGCHTAKYNDFVQSGHPYKLRITNGATPSLDTDPLSALLSMTMPTLAALNDDVSVPDFQIDLNADGRLDWSSVSYVIGGYGWKARWGIKDTSGDDKTGYVWSSAALSGGVGAQFNMLAADPALDPMGKRADWSTYGSASGQSKKYECATCHNTNGAIFTPGYDCYVDSGARTEPWASTGLNPVNHGGFYSEWSLSGVQCEACHGTGANHVKSPSVNAMTVNASKDVCGVCHMRAENTAKTGAVGNAECGGPNAGLNVASYLANGAKITGDYINHHEQYNELVGLNDGVHRNLNCVQCHDPHKRSHKLTDTIASVLGITDNNLTAEERGAVVSCESCHQPGTPDAAGGGADLKVSALSYHVSGIKCSDCHMAEATKSATNESPDGTWGRNGDVKTHIFKIDPAATTITRSNGFTNVAANAISVKYACGKCHDSSMSSYIGIPLTEDQAKAAAAGIHP